jgi:hypothetical protein
MALQMVRKNARLPVPLNSMTIVGTGATYTRDAANQFSISMPTAAATIRLEIPLVHQFPYFLEGGSSTAAVGNLSGFLLRQILLWYSIGSVDLTSHTITIASEVIAGNAARAAAVAAGGALTYNTDDGTSAALGHGPAREPLQDDRLADDPAPVDHRSLTRQRRVVAGHRRVNRHREDPRCDTTRRLRALCLRQTRE